jgi:hypothetical protein
MSGDTEYASKGVATAGLTLGTIGTVLGVLKDGGGLRGILGGDSGRRDERLEMAYAIENERRIGKLESRVEGLEIAEKKDAEIAALRDIITKQNMDIQMAHTVKGQVYLSPRHMADPYMGGHNVLLTEHFDGHSPRGRRPEWDQWY